MTLENCDATCGFERDSEMFLEFVSPPCIEQSKVVDATFQTLDVVFHFNSRHFAILQVVDSSPNATDVLLLDGNEPAEHQLVQNLSVSWSHYSKFLMGHTEASFHQHGDDMANNSRCRVS